MAAIFYYVTVTPFVMVQFCPTFDMLFSGPNSTRKYHKTFSCNFFGVSQHYDPTTVFARLCVFGGLCVDMWRLVHQWSFFAVWLSFGCFWRLVHCWYSLGRHVTIGQLWFLLFWLSFDCFWLFFDEWYTVPIAKTVKTIGVPIVTGLSRLYEQCTNSVPIVKNSQNTVKTAQNVPNTQSRLRVPTVLPSSE